MCPPTTEPIPDNGPYPAIEGYRIEGILGEGAVGRVYRARRIDTGVSVALKVLHVVGAKRRKHIARLVKEGRVMSRLNHPGIVKGIDVGESGGLYFIAMELVEGSSIRDLLEKGRIFSEREAIDFAVRVVKALDHAHRQGVVHRDIKPANLMLTNDGKVKVTDLGLAKDAIDLSLTRSDATVGTPQYIAPEQARDSQSVDHRSDMFSLGATLYHMVTGSPPFGGESLAEIITQVLYERELPPEKINPALSAPFSKLLGRLLAKRPEDRYESYRDLLVDIERVRTGRDIAAPPPGPAPPRRVSPWQIIVPVAAVVIVVVFIALRSRTNKTPVDPTPTPVTEKDPKPAPPDPAVEAERRRLRRLMNLQNRLLASVARGDVRGALSALDEERPLYTGVREQEQFAGIEGRVKSEIRQRVRKQLFEAWAPVQRDADAALGRPPGPGILAAVRAGLSAFEAKLQDVPTFLDESMRAEFGDRIAAVRLRAKRTASTWAADAIRDAREYADALSFVAAEEAIARLERWEVGLYASDHVAARDDAIAHIAARRAIARASFEEDYSRFWTQFERALASARYADAAGALDRFHERTTRWQQEAPRESADVVRYIASDRGDLAAVLAIWRKTVDALVVLQGRGGTDSLAFGAEASRKRVVAIDNAQRAWPEEIVLRVALPGGRQLEHALTALNPEDAVRLARRADPSIQARWIGLFYYFLSRRPDLSLERARTYLMRARRELSSPDDPYRARIDDWTRVLNQTAQQRVKTVEAMHDRALAHYRAWAFKKAADVWTEIRATYADVYRDRADFYAAHLARAEKAIPLEAIARRFPGADREHLDQRHPLAFRLRWSFGADTDLSGLRFAWESWQKTRVGLARVAGKDLHHRTKQLGFPVSWGLRVPIRLNHSHDVRLKVRVRTDPNTVMSLLCVSLGGCIVGVANLDGFEDLAGIPPQFRNQLNLWTESRADARRDVMRSFSSKLVLRSVGTVPKRLRLDYRLRLGQQHELGLAITDKGRRFLFEADGRERHKLRDNRLPDVDFAEVRCWSAPITIEAIEIEGVAR